MKTIFSINHPAHVHFFKNTIYQFEKMGKAYKVIARDKDITLELLDYYKIDYEVGTKQTKGFLKNILEIISYQYKLYKMIRSFRPELIVSISGMFTLHVAWLCRIRNFIFNDTEHAKLDHLLTYPLAKEIYTPDCYFDDLGKKQIKYRGYHELAYLHPHHFSADASILKEIGLEEDQLFFVLRFVSWQASHDIGQKGFSLEGKRKLIKMLEPHGKVIITSEKTLPQEFEKYSMKICPTKIHDLLYYAKMYIGEGGTMASEAAVLGTPAIFVNTLKLGYLDELEQRYDLLYSFSEQEPALEKVKELLQINNLSKTWQIKRQKMLVDKINVTDYILEIIGKSAN